MKNHDILFDKTNQRIGFIKANCSAEYSIETYPKHLTRETGFNWGLIPLILFLFSILFMHWKERRNSNSVNQ